MHKKSVESNDKLKEKHLDPKEGSKLQKENNNNTISSESKIADTDNTPTPTPAEDKTHEADKLRSDSIASLRAKALEHSVKLGMFPSSEREELHNRLSNGNSTSHRVEDMIIRDSPTERSNSPEQTDIDVESNDNDRIDQSDQRRDLSFH